MTSVCVCSCVQVAFLSQKNLSLEQRLEAVCQENAGLQDSLASLHKRLVLQEEQCLQRTQQVFQLVRPFARSLAH